MPKSVAIIISGLGPPFTPFNKGELMEIEMTDEQAELFLLVIANYFDKKPEATHGDRVVGNLLAHIYNALVGGRRDLLCSVLATAHTQGLGNLVTPHDSQGREPDLNPLSDLVN